MIMICSILIASCYFCLDPPSSQAECLTCHENLSTAWLYFIVGAVATFMFLALMIIVLNILLRKNKYVSVAIYYVEFQSSQLVIFLADFTVAVSIAS